MSTDFGLDWCGYESLMMVVLENVVPFFCFFEFFVMDSTLDSIAAL